MQNFGRYKVSTFLPPAQPLVVETGVNFEYIRIINNSPYLLNVTFEGLGSIDFPEYFLEDIAMPSTYRGKIVIVPSPNLLNTSSSPTNLISVNAYINGELNSPQSQPLNAPAVTATATGKPLFTATFGSGATVGIAQTLNIFNPANSGVSYTFHSARAFSNDNTTPTVDLLLQSGADLNFGTAVNAVCHDGSATPRVSTAHCTANDGTLVSCGGLTGSLIEVMDMQQNLTQDMLAFPDQVTLAPGNNLRITLVSGASGHIIRLSLKYAEDIIVAPAPAAVIGGVSTAAALISAGLPVGTTLISSTPQGQSQPSLFVTNDGLATWQALIAGVYHQILKASSSGNPVQLGQVGDLVELLGSMLLDGGLLGVLASGDLINAAGAASIFRSRGGDIVFETPANTEVGRMNNIGEYSHTLANLPSLAGLTGTLVLRQPFKGADYKKVVGFFSGFRGNGQQTLALHTAFATRGLFRTFGAPSTGLQLTSGGVAQTMDIQNTWAAATPGGTTVGATTIFANSEGQCRTGFDSVRIVTGDANTTTALFSIEGF